MDLALTDKSVLITGAAQGISRECARILAEYGCNIIAVDIQKEKLKETQAMVEGIGRRCMTAVADVRDEKAVNEAVKRGIEAFGQIDILVNGAGIPNASMIVDLHENEWDRVMDINAKGVFLFCKAVARHMIDKGIKGKIVNISSQAGKLGEVATGVYCCSKAAVSMLTQVLGLELAPYRINVNAVCPGPTDTHIMQDVFKDRAPLKGMTPEEYEKEWYEVIPLGRLCKPTEVSELIAFLASDISAYMTGVSVTMAGGMTLI